MEMDIGYPTDVRLIAHVTFDRLQGFLGLPVEFELEVPRRVPSASTSAFGVSAESMQCSFDAFGNSVPTILLLLQERLYEQGGLKTEGIFRINPDNGKEEQLRKQLNNGIVPYDIDVHCLAGLIKAWFRELPKGVLDILSPEQVMECHTEDQCFALVKTLPPTEAALLDWAINLMADVVQEEACNKMNARNVAVVFAPNMIQVLDPLTALKHAVQVMNLLKTLILKKLKDRKMSVIPARVVVWKEPLPGENGSINSTKQLKVVNVTSPKGTPLNRGNGRTEVTETPENSNVTKMKSFTQAFAAGSEMVEKAGSVHGSECGSFADSSGRESRSEDGNLLENQQGLSGRWIMSTASDEISSDTVENRPAEKSQPFATLLRKGRSSSTKNQCRDDSSVNEKGSSGDGSRMPGNVDPLICGEKSHRKDGAHVSLQGSQKPLSDWLHNQIVPGIGLRLMGEASAEKIEKRRGIKPSMEKPILAESRTRATYPLSKRTQYLKNNGMV
ncbi:hypothetical protein KP509_28G020500 [Ceratopteris richardii]|uniref:Rho-GAP domain-containing protein n=1 Tax=Ceratopteris richardii TaxID=49495 RepID=A0A8T2RA66_CERRI|nr:hypothetical protein KP509_28G020500 [Ceratopteris richardii]KAH7293311.1 hypothetical protein KP509_28G020500 [Ceratopteris richardii]KAH7293312.1 hypothetical protein KP509_28G020500 [Ceratopteris richardii]